jgi:hypothetical protein
MIHFKVLEKQEQANPQISKRKKIIKIRAWVNEMKIKEQYQGSMKQLVLWKHNQDW